MEDRWFGNAFQIFEANENDLEEKDRSIFS